MNEDEIRELYFALARVERDPAADGKRLAQMAAECTARLADPDRQEHWRDDFDNCFHAIAASSALLVSALTQWLTRPEFLPLAMALLDHISRNTLTRAVPLDLPIAGVPVEQAVLVAYRLCARFTPPAFSLGWLLSLARDYPNVPVVTTAVDTLLAHHAEEYLRGTHALLTAEVSAFQQLPVVQAMAPRLTQQVADEAVGPRLRELEMTPTMRLQQAGLKRSEQRDIERRSRAGSVLTLIATQQRVKYATRVALPIIDGDDVREAPLAMAGHRLAIELPLSELTDPLFGHWRRRQLWRGPAQ
ncbi:MAG: hypothetical protein ACT4NL_02390 [Pseudomarimonas sp.]